MPSSLLTADPELDLVLERVVDVPRHSSGAPGPSPSISSSGSARCPGRPPTARSTCSRAASSRRRCRAPRARASPTPAAGCRSSTRNCWCGPARWARASVRRPRSWSPAVPFLMSAIIALQDVDGGTKYTALVRHGDAAVAPDARADGLPRGLGQGARPARRARQGRSLRIGALSGARDPARRGGRRARRCCASSSRTARTSSAGSTRAIRRFYSEQGVAAAIAAAEAAWASDQAFQYLVVEDGRIVGRVNLTAVRRAHFHCADLGYRIGEHDGGRGVASRAVALCLEQAFGAHGLGASRRSRGPRTRARSACSSATASASSATRGAASSWAGSGSIGCCSSGIAGDRTGRSPGSAGHDPPFAGMEDAPASHEGSPRQRMAGHDPPTMASAPGAGLARVLSTIAASASRVSGLARWSFMPAASAGRGRWPSRWR